MKRILLILMILWTLPVSSKELNSAKTALNKCDEIQQTYLDTSDNLTNADMVNSVHTLVKCYKDNAYTIIDKYYSKNSTKLKESFDDYTKATFELSGDIYLLNDDCPDYCGGKILILIYSDSAANKIKEMILEMILGVKTIGGLKS